MVRYVFGRVCFRTGIMSIGYCRIGLQLRALVRPNAGVSLRAISGAAFKLENGGDFLIPLVFYDCVDSPDL